VYLEKKQMFRSGLFVVGTATAGTNQVRVQIPTGLSWNQVALRPGDSIRLVHAPRLDGEDMWTGFYWEDAIVEDVAAVQGAKNRRLLTLSASLAHSYYEDRSLTDALAVGLADGVGNNSAGVYTRNEWYITTAFNPAYVQFSPVDQGVSEIPYLPVLRSLNRFSNKWFENTWINPASLARPGNENVKHVLAGTGEPDGTSNVRVSALTFGRTGTDSVTPPSVPDYVPEANWSWTYVGAIERAVALKGNPFRGLDPWIFNGENVVHELAHTFGVNFTYYYGDDAGHCDRPMAGNPALLCKMHSLRDPLFRPAENGDGEVGFHYSSDVDSEYMTFRKAWEPLATPLN